MLNNFASTQGGGTDTVTTTMILDGTIANADVASDAAIDVSKINLGNTVEMETSSGDQIFEMDNNAANSSNFQIQNGAGNARTDLYLDGSAVITLKGQSVGIGDTSPSYALDVNDTGRFTSNLIVGGNLTVGDGGAEDQKIVFDGNAQDFYVGLDDTTDDLVIGLGSAVGTTAAISINEDQDVTITDGAIDFDVASHDGTNGLKLGGTLVTSSATELNLLDGKTIGAATGIGDTYGPGSSTDMAIARFDGAGGKTLQMSNMTISDDPPVVKIGDGAAEDTMLTFDGNAADFRIGLDDGNDTLEIGGGTSHGTAAGISMDVNGDMTLGGGIVCSDEVISRPRLTDYSETVNAIGSKTAAFDIDLEDGNVQTLTMSGGGTFNIGIVNAVSSHSNSVTILGTNLGSCTGTFLAGANGGGGNAVYWAGGGDTSDNLMTSSGTDVVTLTTFDGGTNWYGFVAGKEFANS